MSRVTAVFDDLLLGSNVLGMLRTAGHDATLVADPGQVPPDAELAIVDLTGGFDGIGAARAAPRTLAVYSHVDAETRARADAAGFDLVVPRSRLAREGAALVERVLAG